MISSADLTRTAAAERAVTPACSLLLHWMVLKGKGPRQTGSIKAAPDDRQCPDKAFSVSAVVHYDFAAAASSWFEPAAPGRDSIERHTLEVVMTRWHDTMVDQPETDGATYLTGWTVSGLAVLGTIVAVWALGI